MFIRSSRVLLLGSSAIVSLFALNDAAYAQDELPPVEVTAPSPIRRPARTRVTRPAPAAPARTRTATPTPPQPAPPPTPPAVTWSGWQGTLPVVTDQFSTVTVVPSEELRRDGKGTLGDVLFSKPGITGSSFAPGAASRPIIRGLDNNRVRIQENGIGANGASDLGEDHGVPIDPLSTNQIEVVRGPATLRWGSQAIGGVVNASNNRIPEALPCPTGGPSNSAAILKAPAASWAQGACATLETRTAITTVDNGIEGAALLDAGFGNFAFHADTYGRRTDDYRIPSYPYLFPPDPRPVVQGKQPNSAMHSNGEAVGGSYVFDGGFVGLSVSQFSTLYRVPGIEATETNTRIDMNQTKVLSKGEYRPQTSGIDAIRFWAGVTNYKHNELADEGGFDGIQQTFTNNEQEGRVEVQLMPFDLRFATLTTALGVQGWHQRLTAPGHEPGPQSGLFDPNTTNLAAGYLFNEFKFTDTFRAQVAGRIESNEVKGTVADLFVDPDLPIGYDRKFTPKSAAIGFLQDLPWDLVASLTGQYVERAPRAAELFSRGVHEATGTFDIGNPNLTIEAAKSVEVSLRRGTGPLRFEVNAYYTRFDGFIFRFLDGATCDDSIASCTPGPGGEFNQALYSQRDATFRGGEFQFQYDALPLWTGVLGVEGQYDIVRATFTDGTNVPRIPPQRLGGGVYWRDPNWLARVFLLHAFEQNDVAPIAETPTAGYNLLKAELSYKQTLKPSDLGPREINVGILGDNLLNADIRNAVSFKKDEVLMPGIGVRLFANMKF